MFTSKQLCLTQPFNSTPCHFALFQSVKGAMSWFPQLEKFLFFNPCLSSPSLTILAPLRFVIISLVFFYPTKPPFSDFFQLKGNFRRGQKNSKFHNWAPLVLIPGRCFFCLWDTFSVANCSCREQGALETRQFVTWSIWFS